MKTIEILPARRLRGEASVPGDKSIGHRVALIGAVSEGRTRVENYPRGEDCQSSLRCIEELGVVVDRERSSDADTLTIHGRGLGGLQAPSRDVDAGNSGTTVRLLAGILAGHSFPTTLVGDASLQRRPMQRVVEPLERFGANVRTTDGHLPMTVAGGVLRAVDYALRVPSAQVKSAVLLAGLYAEGTTIVRESIRTRNHTEIALADAGAALRVVNRTADGGLRIEVDGRRALTGRSIRIPGDLSSAAFLIAAALLLPDSELRLAGVGVNPTRADILSVLSEIGGNVQLESRSEANGEAVADIVVRASMLGPLEVSPEQTAGLIDELPILAVLGVCGAGSVTIRGATELRYKETDRIRALAENLRSVGAEVDEFEDGFGARCSGPLDGGTVSSFGDHRIAMAFAVAGLVSRTGIRIENPGCADISFPGFFGLLDRLVER